MLKRPFEKALLNAFSEAATRAVREHREEYARILGSRLFEMEGPRFLDDKFLTPADNFIRTLGLEWIEIVESAQALEAVPKYLGKESGRPASITRVQNLRYHYEHYFHEVYILKERLSRFLKIIQRKYRREEVTKTIKKLESLVSEGFESLVSSRSVHVHKKRFSDPDIDRLKGFQIVAGNNRTFRRQLQRILRDVRRKKLEQIKSNNYAIEKLLNEYCRMLYPILFDKKGKPRFPAGIDAA